MDPRYEEIVGRIMREQKTVGRFRKARRPRRIEGGRLVIGATYNNQAICYWNSSQCVNARDLRAMYEEAKAMDLETPLHVYGGCCLIADTHPSTFTFHQIAP